MENDSTLPGSLDPKSNQSVVTPYYSEPGIDIYCGDSREILPKLGIDFSSAALVTDPPYKVDFGAGKKRTRNSGLAFGAGSEGVSRDPDFKNIVGQNEDFDPTPWLEMGWSEYILWGANRYASKLPDSKAWLVWNKLEDKKPCDYGDGETAWTNLDQPLRIWNQLWRGLVRRGEENVANTPKMHQFQKPIELMRWCVGFTSAPIIVDPYMGSGPTIQAARDLGRKAIGIELEEKNCRHAVNRLKQMVFGIAV